MKIVLGLILLFLIFPCFGQKITISGKAIDNETKEPLPFATIGIKGKPIGTITNLQGDFDFHIPTEMISDIMIITMLGYKNYEAPIWTLNRTTPSQFELVKSPFILETVVVSDTLSGGDIMQISLSRIENNYPMTPYLMEGFYRDYKKLGGTYISLLEAAVKIYDEDYKEPRNKFKLRERVVLLEVRRSVGYENKFTSFFDQDNLLEDLLLNNNIRYRQFSDEPLFFSSITREKDSYLNGQEVYVISHKRDYLLRIYVEKETYGIIHLEYENHEEMDWEKKRGMQGKFVKIKRVIDFKKYNNKLYLNYLIVDSQINWYDRKTQKLKFETELHQQLLVNEVFPETEDHIGVTQKMRSYGLQYQDMPYHEEFWKNYNMIKDSPLDKKILQDLEKDAPLEKQFKEDN